MDANSRVASEPKSSDHALLKADALQNAIFNSANFSYIATDSEGVIQIFNVGAERMLGYRAGEMVDKVTPAAISDADELIVRATALSQLASAEIRPGFEALVYKARRGIEDIYELTYIRKDGSRFPAIVSVTALQDAQGKVIGYLLIGTDNTERKQVEAAHAAAQAVHEQSMRAQQKVLEVKNIELDLARSAAEKANLAKSEFLSSMSHELRTPLNAVLGFAQLMESATPLPTPAQKLSIEQILKGGWYLLHLINEILDLAMIESGKLAMAKEQVSLTEVLQDCRSLIQPQAEKNGIHMNFPAFDTAFYVNADHTRVKQVMINLLSNAIKYNRRNGEVQVRCELASENRVRVSVADTGAGLSAAQLAQLFQPFNRLGQEKGGEEGTGVGLVVTKQLVELMGGTVGVESSVDIGSTFWIELPAISAADVTDGGHPALIPAVELAALERVFASARTVLYVEDNPANLALVEQLIARRSDVQLLTAVEAQAGIELARKHIPDVILMDINLPGMNGYEALDILRKDPLTAHIPVLAISANAIPLDIERGLHAGFFSYLTKPIKFGAFTELLDVALRHAAETRPAAAPTDIE
jgi:PAS domain S-box-containing protein